MTPPSREAGGRLNQPQFELFAPPLLQVPGGCQAADATPHNSYFSAIARRSRARLANQITLWRLDTVAGKN